MKNNGICSPETMIEAIREIGIIPFSKNIVPGWSIQEMTDPDFWFTTSDELGPWDWKIEAVRQGIVYGKFISRKSAFATAESYKHLMSWRRSLPKYQIPVGRKVTAKTLDDKLMLLFSPILLESIRSKESLESSEIRSVLEELVPPEARKSIGGHLEKYLLPHIKKQAVDFLLQYLDMGTWTVVGDITRVYRGPNCEYKGWQRNSITTPDLLFEELPLFSDNPAWAKFQELCTEDQHPVNCKPEESRNYLLDKLERFYPGTRNSLEKLL